MSPSGPYTQDPQSSPSTLVNRHKRRGVALSCAECRRLKLKCSRQFPCSNCVKKGCSAICPDGSLTTGKGNRFVLANTEALHEKINSLANRVRALEDALTQSHSLNSSECHPLLSDELLQIKRPLERERSDGSAKPEKAESGEAIDALGSLSISQSGKSTFFGTAANSWYLLQNEEGSEEEETLPPQYVPHMPHDLPWLSHGFPFTSAVSKTSEAVKASLISHLPPLDAAKRIANLYFRHAAWMYTPLSEQEFYSHILPGVYGAEDAYIDSVHSHSLSVFLMVLALGTLLDLDLPAHSQEAMQYFQLGRAALALDSVLEEQSIIAIQALLLMCHFMFLSDMAGPRWVLMGIVVKVAQSIGLHRDSGKWKLDAEETQKRRELFYEILTYDSWQSLTFGRPPSLSTLHIDNRLPHESVTTSSGDVEMTFTAWKHSFSAECLSVVHDRAFGTRTPSYAAIQELDIKVRNWYVPPSLKVPGFGNSKIGPEVEQPSIELTMQRHIAFAIREITLFYMHRGFFAQALEDCPTDPTGSKYGQSVLAAYGSAMTFVALIRNLYKQHPRLTERMWFLFTHVFSCAIVLGSIAVKPRMPFARSALDHLDAAYQLFSEVTDTTRTSKILPILQKLKDRAYAVADPSSVTSNTLPSDPASRLAFFNPPIKTEEADLSTELSALGGMTRLVARRTTPSSPSCSASNPSSPPQYPSSPPLSHVSGSTTSLASYSQLTRENNTPANSTSSWQNYTHIQNLNVNINVGEYPYSGQGGSTPNSTGVHGSSSSLSQQDHNTVAAMGYGYHGQHSLGHLHHQQQQHQHQSHHLQAPQQNGLDGTPDYYSYSGYSMQAMINDAPMHDIDYSWQNLVAQYK